MRIQSQFIIEIQSFYGQRGVVYESFKLSPVTEIEVYNCVSELKINTASGLIAPYVSPILNLSIEQGKEPINFKNDTVIPAIT